MPLYFLAIIPSNEICKRVKSLKQEIAKKYEAEHALKLPAHITLQIPFKISEAEEEKLIDILECFAKNQKSFQLNLKDFGRFGQKVIFINIEDHEPLKILHTELQKVISANLQLKKHEKFSKIHPHITLASRDLHYKQFPEAWADFKTRDFTDSFTAQSFSLLKHDGKVWHQHRDFPLN
ncbi:2'-5' RNA ligase family protein [Salegentibacter salegens]|uniref:2'-5' RNA ligase n=1 Tax=Salegentibacter salegens TaxID=143223 RepID=A0A1M7KF92_9FLAO|nr:2'-5' RNA ligase family protein [Salegentibacter salegens]PRX49630.1 2'-5' RNA ligase [Salegentibacter salegens]SHM63973.1 2'-5' RNA ligase [Salegentibacter salegens]